jgi:hypothetical protein
MDISAYLNMTLAWFASQFASLSQVPPAYIAAAAVVPVLMALVAGNLLATLWTALLALCAVDLCTMEAVPWNVLAMLAVAAGFLLALSAMIGKRRNRALRDELAELKGRLNQLEVDEARKFMVALRNPGPPASSGEAIAEEARH